MARKPQNSQRPSPGNEELHRFAERVETLEVERRELAASIRDVLEEAADKGLHKKAIRAIVALRLESSEQTAKRISFEDAVDDYKSRLGMLAGTPLGDAAVISLHTQQ